MHSIEYASSTTDSFQQPKNTTRHHRVPSTSIPITPKSISASPSPAVEENDFLSRMLLDEQGAIHNNLHHSRTSSMSSPTHELPNSPTHEQTAKVYVEVIRTSTPSSPETLPPISPTTWTELTRIREEARAKERAQREQELAAAESARNQDPQDPIDQLRLFEPIPVSDDEN